MTDNTYYLNMAKNVLMEIKKSVVGKDEVICKIMMAILARGHVLIEDIPGVGKTTMALAFAETLGLKCNRVQFTPDVMPSDIVGFNMYNRATNKFEYKAGAADCNILLADEINRATPRTQSSLLEAMEEQQVTIDGESHKLETPFFVIATENPIETTGTYPLPEAQLDRFLFKVLVTYPTREEELQVLDLMASSAKPPETSPVTTPEQVAASRDLVNQIYIDDAVRGYIVDLVRATRFPETVDVKLRGLIRAGASPRATINLALAARANAFMHHRSFVTPQDIKDLAHDILRHRILLSYEAEAENISTDDVIDHILTKVPVP